MTQGLVTVRKAAKVTMKIVTGMGGMQAKKLAKAIRKLGRVPRLGEAYQLALDCGFGDATSLVVVGKKRSQHKTSDRLPRLYRATFNQAHFNPRWKHGTADHVEIIDL